MTTWPAEMPTVECKVLGETFSIECVEMYGGCLPEVGHTSTRATYTYPHAKQVSLSRCEVICELKHSDMAVYEIAESSPGSQDLPDLWYEGQSNEGVFGLFLFKRSKHEIGYFEQYSGQGEPDTPLMLTPGFHREYEWTENVQGVKEPWLVVNDISGAVRLRLGEKEFKCLVFEEMILTTQRQPVHFNVSYLNTSGRRVLIRRWEGAKGAKQGLLQGCDTKTFKGYTWRQHYDVVGDVFLNGDDTG